jgi:hypothetical protein
LSGDPSEGLRDGNFDMFGELNCEGLGEAMRDADSFLAFASAL